VAGLAADEPERAREEVRAAIEGWSRRGFHFQHFSALVGETEIALYLGDAVNARGLLSKRWPELVKSRLLRVQIFRVEAVHLRGRCALAAAAKDKDLHSAERDARLIEREGVPWADPLAKLLRAGIASVRGRREEARDLLEKAEEGFVAADMALYAAAARRRRGEMLGGEGKTRVEAADEWMSRQGIQDPARMAQMLAPSR
jgi:hypothetical protein